MEVKWNSGLALRHPRHSASAKPGWARVALEITGVPGGAVAPWTVFQTVYGWKVGGTVVCMSFFACCHFLQAVSQFDGDHTVAKVKRFE